MARLQRVTSKVFAENATEVGQFGSLNAGTKVTTTDISTIQALPAWQNGWQAATVGENCYPTLQERNGLDKVQSYFLNYLLQEGIPEWDSGTTYYTGSIVKLINGVDVQFYKSLKDNNTAVLSDTDYWEKVQLGGGASRNIGEIVTSTIPLTDAGLHLLDGTLLPYGVYKEFIDYIADLYAENPTANYFCTEVEWQQSVTTYGVCGKFVYDSVNNTVRLPKYSNKIYTQEFDATAPVVGNGMTLGLANGTGNAGLFNGSNPASLYATPNAYGTDIGSSISVQAPLNARTVGVTTNPTKSGLVAQLSNITTSLDGYYYIVIATSTKTDIQVDIDEIATDLNGKADTDLSNVTDTGYIKMAGAGMPDYVNGKVINLALNVMRTVTADKYVIVGVQGTYNNVILYDPNGNLIPSAYYGTSGNAMGVTSSNSNFGLFVPNGYSYMCTGSGKLTVVEYPLKGANE